MNPVSRFVRWLAQVPADPPWIEQRDALVYDPIFPRDPALADLFRYTAQVGAGVAVTERTAISWTALASAIRLCAEQVAAMPVNLIRRNGRDRTILSDHAVARVLRQPNEEISGYEFRELMQTHMDLWGNSYAQIIWDGAGRPIELWPLNPDRVTVDRNGAGFLQYRVGVPNEPFGQASKSVTLPADEVLHIRGWSPYGILGARLVQVFREAIGLGLATEIFGALFFGQGANAGGFLEHPAHLTEEAIKRLRKQKEEQSAGLSRSHRIMILEEGMKWQQTTIEPEKAQFIGTRQFQLAEAARIIRVPPHKIYDLTRSTFANIEEQNIEFVTDSLVPRVVRWESRLAMQLLGPKDAANVDIKFDFSHILRGNLAAQAAFFTAGRQGGWFSANDVRELLDMEPRKDEGGDAYATLPAGVPKNTTTEPAQPAPGGRND